MSTLPRSFYLRDTVKVARDLLGKKIVRRIGRTEISGTITETEAYRHTDDSASHAYSRMTERNRAMFGEVGRAYVYFTYGMHYCFNVVARDPNIRAGAVLVRAIRPEKGMEIMQENRGTDNIKILANGPAKMAQALQITKEHYGMDLTKKGELFIAEGVTPKEIVAGPRIGIAKATENMWNFRIA